MIRILLFITGIICIAGMLAWWHFSLGFDLTRPDHWFWLKSWLKEQHTLPPQILASLYITGSVLITLLTVISIIASKTGSKTILGAHNQDTLHGSARWARLREIRKAGLFSKKGVVVGGFKKGSVSKTRVLRHDGPEHVLAFAPKGEKLDDLWIVNSKLGDSIDDLDLSVKEIEATQAKNHRSKSDKTYHLLVSFRDEKPSPDALRDIEQEMAKALGFGDHQRVVATHHNTGHCQRKLT